MSAEQTTVPAHWRSLSANPIAPVAMAYVKQQLDATYAGPIIDLRAFWAKELTGKDLLDIGVVEHSRELMERPDWKHGAFAKLARRAVGVDILPDEIEHLQRQGFDVRVADATSDHDLGERFDVAFCGDVIEHVNDPVRLIQFAVRHLRPGGEAIFTTPCPFWFRNILLMAKDSTYIGNVDHVRWITPVNALELAHRAGVTLKRHHTVEAHGQGLLKATSRALVRAIFGRTEFFTWQYVYVFEASCLSVQPSGGR